MTHYKQVYECGHIRAQCRCCSPSKSVIQVKGRCEVCEQQIELLIEETK